MTSIKTEHELIYKKLDLNLHSKLWNFNMEPSTQLKENMNSFITQRWESTEKNMRFN